MENGKGKGTAVGQTLVQEGQQVECMCFHLLTVIVRAVGLLYLEMVGGMFARYRRHNPQHGMQVSTLSSCVDFLHARRRKVSPCQQSSEDSS